MSRIGQRRRVGCRPLRPVIPTVVRQVCTHRKLIDVISGGVLAIGQLISGSRRLLAESWMDVGSKHQQAVFQNKIRMVLRIVRDQVMGLREQV